MALNIHFRRTTQSPVLFRNCAYNSQRAIGEELRREFSPLGSNHPQSDYLFISSITKIIKVKFRGTTSFL